MDLTNKEIQNALDKTFVIFLDGILNCSYTLYGYQHNVNIVLRKLRHEALFRKLFKREPLVSKWSHLCVQSRAIESLSTSKTLELFRTGLHQRVIRRSDQFLDCLTTTKSLRFTARGLQDLSYAYKETSSIEVTL